MDKKKYNFYEFFYLTSSDNFKINKKAICFLYIKKYTLFITITNSKYFILNKVLLYYNYLKKYENFAFKYNESKK